MKITERMRVFLSETKPHLAILNKIITTLEMKFAELLVDINPYENKRKKRGPFNFLGGIFKVKLQISHHFSNKEFQLDN